VAFFRDRQDRQDRHAEPAEPVQVVQAQPEEPLPVPPSSGTFLGTGRRKSAVARVRLIPGKGKIEVNDRECDQYFTEPQERSAVRDPLFVTKTLGHFDVFVRVHGGGHSGQSHAVRMGVARALVAADKRYDSTLRRNGFLTRDARAVERKKYGRRKARRRFQFSKR
jgi:small subunit ribosomal protein S9